jgi:beta-fructofuranosidase
VAGAGWVNLEWDAKGKDKTLYIISRAKKGGDEKEIAKTDKTAWFDDNLEYDEEYTYRVVVSLDGGKSSPLGDPICIKTKKKPGMSHRPEIVGEWKLLFKPQKTGSYINDHTLIKGPDGQWHVIGITRLGNSDPHKEFYFAHGVGKNLAAGNFEEKEKLCDYGKLAYAPHAIKYDDTYYMFWSPLVCHLDVSKDLFKWERRPDVIPKPPHEHFRDTMVFEVQKGAWLMYATAKEKNGKYGLVSLYSSYDLFNWSFLGYALRTDGKAPLNPKWGATESPFVIYYEGWYYLSITYTDSSPENYANTLVFRSGNPYNFGTYTGDNEGDIVVSKLKTHAPEYVYDDEAKQWYITYCGWLGKKIPFEGGVAIAPLKWVEAQK